MNKLLVPSKGGAREEKHHNPPPFWAQCNLSLGDVNRSIRKETSSKFGSNVFGDVFEAFLGGELVKRKMCPKWPRWPKKYTPPLWNPSSFFSRVRGLYGVYPFRTYRVYPSRLFSQVCFPKAMVYTMAWLYCSVKPGRIFNFLWFPANRTGEPRPLDCRHGHFRGHFRGRLSGTFRGSFRGSPWRAEDREINPCGSCRGRSRGRSRGRIRGSARGPTRGATRGPTRGSRFAFACSVRRPFKRRHQSICGNMRISACLGSIGQSLRICSLKRTLIDCIRGETNARNQHVRWVYIVISCLSFALMLWSVPLGLINSLGFFCRRRPEGKFCKLWRIPKRFAFLLLLFRFSLRFGKSQKNLAWIHCAWISWLCYLARSPIFLCIEKWQRFLWIFSCLVPRKSSPKTPRIIR